MAHTFADYQKKQNELVEMAKALEGDLTAEVMQYLKNIRDSIENIKKVNPKFNITELAEWKQMCMKAGVEGYTAKERVKEYLDRVNKPRGKGGGKKGKNAGRVIEFLKANGETSQGDIGTKLKIVGISPLLAKMVKDGLLPKPRKEGRSKLYKAK